MECTVASQLNVANFVLRDGPRRSSWSDFGASQIGSGDGNIARQCQCRVEMILNAQPERSQSRRRIRGRDLLRDDGLRSNGMPVRLDCPDRQLSS
jgi:hypothetical protein